MNSLLNENAGVDTYLLVRMYLKYLQEEHAINMTFIYL